MSSRGNKARLSTSSPLRTEPERHKPALQTTTPTPARSKSVGFIKHNSPPGPQELNSNGHKISLEQLNIAPPMIQLTVLHLCSADMRSSILPLLSKGRKDRDRMVMDARTMRTISPGRRSPGRNISGENNSAPSSVIIAMRSGISRTRVPPTHKTYLKHSSRDL